MLVEFIDHKGNPSCIITGSSPWAFNVKKAFDADSSEEVGHALVLTVGGFEESVPVYTSKNLEHLQNIVRSVAVNRYTRMSFTSQDGSFKFESPEVSFEASFSHEGKP